MAEAVQEAPGIGLELVEASQVRRPRLEKRLGLRGAPSSPSSAPLEINTEAPAHEDTGPSIEMVLLSGRESPQPMEYSGVSASDSGDDGARVTLNVWVCGSQDHKNSADKEREVHNLRAAVLLLQGELAAARVMSEDGLSRTQLEAAREQGLLRAQIAKLEGALLAGEARIRAQAADIEQLKAANEALEREAGELHQQASRTPARAAQQKENLRSCLQDMQQAVEHKSARVEAVVASGSKEDSKERAALREFTALEFSLMAEQEKELLRAVQQAKAAANVAAAELDEAATRATAAEAALSEREGELAAVWEDMEAASRAASSLQEQAAGWQLQAVGLRAQAADIEHDRHQTAATLKKAVQENE